MQTASSVTRANESRQTIKKESGIKIINENTSKKDFHQGMPH